MVPTYMGQHNTRSRIQTRGLNFRALQDIRAILKQLRPSSQQTTESDVQRVIMGALMISCSHLGGHLSVFVARACP